MLFLICHLQVSCLYLCIRYLSNFLKLVSCSFLTFYWMQYILANDYFFWDFSDLSLSQSWRISSAIRGFVFFLLNPITFVAVSFIILLIISVVSSEIIILCVNLFLISFSILSLYWARIEELWFSCSRLQC